MVYGAGMAYGEALLVAFVRHRAPGGAEAHQCPQAVEAGKATRLARAGDRIARQGLAQGHGTGPVGLFGHDIVLAVDGDAREQVQHLVGIFARMRLVIATCAHQRHDVTRMWAEHTSRLGLDIFAAVTEGDVRNVKVLEGIGAKVVQVPNSPLGAKHNAALALAMQEAWDAVMLLPSDDFISARWAVDAMEAVAAGHRYVMPPRCAIYDVATGRAAVLKAREKGSRSFGAGRVVTRDVLDQVGTLWTDGKERSLDTDSHCRLSAAGAAMHVAAVDYVPVVDLKTTGNLWGFDTWKRGAEARAADVLWMLSDAHRAELTGAVRVRY